MEFDLSEEQRLFTDTLGALLNDQVDLDKIRAVAEAGTGLDPELWQQMTELGVPGLVIDEAHGGVGLGVFEAAIAAEALGYGAAPLPFAATSVMAPLAIATLASPAQQSALLPSIAGGERRVAVGLQRDARFEGNKVSAELDAVIDAGGATDLLVLASDGRAACVSADDSNVSIALQPSLDRTRPVATATIQGADAEILVGNSAAGVDSVIDAGRVMLAADTLGAAQRMIDDAVAYVKEREQFGRAVGSFQSVKHVCAEMVSMLEPCRALVWYAAYVQDTKDPEARSAACHAKAHLGEVGRDVARMATECHGGMGFTDLLGLHYWLKRIGADRQLLGAPEQCRQEAAVAQGWIGG